jgi:hypothetical protein
MKPIDVSNFHFTNDWNIKCNLILIKFNQHERFHYYRILKSVIEKDNNAMIKTQQGK